MGAISSVNFKKSNAVQTRHNDRDLPPNYLIGGEVECNRKHQEALALKNQMIKNAIEKYNEKTGQKFQAKSYEWSAVVNIKETTSMNDLENLSKHFQEKYGFQCYQIAIHRDEGHINEQGEKVINHHAHMEFITLDRETGKNNYRRELITPKVLRQMQTEVAEILGMKRGEDKRISKRERIEPRKYAKMKEEQKKETKALKKDFTEEKEALETEIDDLKERHSKTREKLVSITLEKSSIERELLSTKEIKARLEQERKAWIEEKDHTAEEYKKLRKIAENQFEKIEDLENAIKALRLELEKEKFKNKKLEEEAQTLKEEVKNRDAFIINLGNLLNFRGLNYNTPINELERYLNAKTIKNEQTIEQERENALKREIEPLNSYNDLMKSLDEALKETQERIESSDEQEEQEKQAKRNFGFYR
ncbi:mobilization protein [Campylobacter peloridis]|uniref:mobilization protein n=1 Tax=Campylobacter peloridis TaxID=488546 RepID=UPI002176D206|nr:mobilization protein [Campylobacter peloridis]